MKPQTAGAGLLAWLAAWVAGTACQVLAAWPVPPQFSAAALALAVAAAWASGLLRRLRHGRWLPASGPLALALLVFSGAAAGWGAAGAHMAARMAQTLPAAAQTGDVRLTGIVAAMPQRGPTGLRFVLEAESAATWPGNTPLHVPRQLQLAWFVPPGSAAPALRAGERWQLTARLRPPYGEANPKGFDAELWLWQQGIRATGSVKDAASARRLAGTLAHPVEQLRQSLRDRLLARLAEQGGDAADSGRPAHAPEAAAEEEADEELADEGRAPDRPSDRAPDRAPDRAFLAGIVAALAVGDQNAISQDGWDVFRATGVAHLMSISGLHITLFAWLAAAAVGGLWRASARLGWRACLVVSAPAAALTGGVALAAGYALLSGWGVPAQRTVLMLAAVALLRLTGLRWPWQATWLAACAAVLALQPWALLQPGFWLSFVAVGMLFASDGPAGGFASGADEAPGPWRRARRFLREQARITLALTPLGLVLFGQASAVALAANLLAIPWVTFIVTPLALGGMVCPPLWHAASWALEPLMVWLQWLAGWPWVSLTLPAAPAWMGLAAVAGGLLLALRWPWSWRMAGLPLLLPLLLWQPPRPAPGHFDLLAADVGQGGGALIRTARHALLYDAGPRYSSASDAGRRILAPLLQSLGEQPNGILISHRDSDHAGGAKALLAAAPRAWLMASFDDAALTGARRALRCQAGQSWTWDGVQFAVLHPLPADYARARQQPDGAGGNALSCVLRVTARNGRAALLTGDIAAVQELDLAARARQDAAARLRADLLLMPHHGSRHSSSDAFLQAVRPAHAIAQAGWRNRFGHPAPQTLARYARYGIAATSTAYCGAALWQSWQPAQLQCERQREKWQWPWRTRPEKEDEALQTLEAGCAHHPCHLRRSRKKSKFRPRETPVAHGSLGPIAINQIAKGKIGREPP